MFSNHLIQSALTKVHKKARTAETKNFAEDDDILRAPVALATVKLLQKLPENMTRQNLHGYLKFNALLLKLQSNTEIIVANDGTLI